MPTLGRRSTKQWAIIIAIVVILHLMLFVFVRPSYVDLFKTSVPNPAETSTGGLAPSAAILTIPIEIEPLSDAASEGEAGTEPPERRKRIVVAEPAEPVTALGEPEADVLLDADDLPGGSPKTLPRSSGSAEVSIPPRAIEITWPDTRKLKHCAGHHIDIRIRVADDGSVIAVEPVHEHQPSDCLRAALESAERIVFEPGRVNGVPLAMWTQVRIEFKTKE